MAKVIRMAADQFQTIAVVSNLLINKMQTNTSNGKWVRWQCLTEDVSISHRRNHSKSFRQQITILFTFNKLLEGKNNAHTRQRRAPAPINITLYLRSPRTTRQGSIFSPDALWLRAGVFYRRLFSTLRFAFLSQYHASEARTHFTHVAWIIFYLHNRKLFGHKKAGEFCTISWCLVPHIVATQFQMENI